MARSPYETLKNVSKKASSERSAYVSFQKSFEVLFLALPSIWFSSNTVVLKISKKLHAKYSVENKKEKQE